MRRPKAFLLIATGVLPDSSEPVRTAVWQIQFSNRDRLAGIRQHSCRDRQECFGLRMGGGRCSIELEFGENAAEAAPGSGVVLVRVHPFLRYFD